MLTSLICMAVLPSYMISKIAIKPLKIIEILIEYFWMGEEPHDLPEYVWSRSKNIIYQISEKLISLSLEGKKIHLEIDKEDRIVPIRFALRSERMACKVKSEEIYFLGASSSLEEIIDDESENCPSQY